jgi:microcystin-dependent protein
MRFSALILSLIFSLPAFAGYDSYPAYTYADKTANYTLKITDTVINANTSGGQFTLTLPTAVGIKGKIFAIVLSTAGNTLTVNTTSSQTIDGVTSKTLLLAGDYLTVLSNNTNWISINTSKVNVANLVGTVSVGNGGTNNASLDVTLGGVLYTDGSKIVNMGVGSTGQVVTSNGSGAPTWGTLTSGGKSTGELFMTAATSCPSGSLAADGSTFSSVTHSALATALGDTYGTHSGSNYYLPNAKGVFIRGAGSQTISSIYYTGTQGTTQGDQMQGHIHAQNMYNPGAGAVYLAPTLNSYINSNATGGPISDGTNGTPRTGSETRPANIVALYCVAY